MRISDWSSDVCSSDLMLETLGWPFPDADPEGDAQGVPGFIAAEDADGYRALVDAERESEKEIERNARRLALEAEDAAPEAVSAAARQRANGSTSGRTRGGHSDETSGVAGTIKK